MTDAGIEDFGQNFISLEGGHRVVVFELYLAAQFIDEGHGLCFWYVCG